MEIEVLKSVLEANRVLLKRARELNERAGEQLFLVPTREQLTELLDVCLQGARCAKEIPDVECLRLPPLNEELVARVLGETPDTVVVLGKERKVLYQDDTAPRVSLNSDDLADLAWRDLPDEGVKLPSGRLVELSLSADYVTHFRDTSVPNLKRKLKDWASQSQWSRFTERPTIELPDIASPHSHVQQVKTVQYGTCVVSGEPLMAYGTAIVNPNRWYSSDIWFKVEWYRDEATASFAHDEAVRKLDQVRVEQREKLEKKARFIKAQEVQESLKTLEREFGRDSELPQNLRDRLDSMAYAWLDENVAADWVIKAEALVAQVKAAAAKIAEEREAAERARQLAEARNLEVYGVTGHLLEIAKAMAERAIERHGNGAVEIFEEELTAPYGRARRQEAIRGRLGNGGATSDFYAMSRARDVDSVLEAAMKLANERKIAAAQKAASSTKPQTPADPKKFDMGQLFGGRAKVRR